LTLHTVVETKLAATIGIELVKAYGAPITMRMKVAIVLCFLLSAPSLIAAQSVAADTPQTPEPGVEILAPAGPSAGSEEEAVNEAEAVGSEEQNVPDPEPAPAVAETDVQEAAPEPAAANDPAPQSSPEAEPSEPSEAEEDEDGLDFFIALRGSYQLRGSFMDDVPLTALPSRGFEPTLGQNTWVAQWLRVGATVGLRERLELQFEMDVARGLLSGDFTNGVTAAEGPRDEVDLFGATGVQLRQLYLEWRSSVGLLRAGLTPSHWGMGILANDGAHERPFGDHEFGDRHIRLAFATKPFGADIPVYAALSWDILYQDILANRRDGDRGAQGVFAGWYEHEHGRLGVYLARRYQDMPVDTGPGLVQADDSELFVHVIDGFARWRWDVPGGGEARLAAEAAVAFGQTNATLTVSDVDDGEHYDDIRQMMASVQLGYSREDWDVALEGGYTSGDSNTEDDVQSRGTMDPDHQVGLILFPEVIAWQTARSATLAGSPELFGRPSRGAEMLPTNGGVSGAMYLFPTVTWDATEWLKLRVGGVWARASADVVDPYRQRAESRSVNYRGGRAENRDLGLELDAAILAEYELARGIRVQGGIEGGYFLPGRAFDDESGVAMDSMGLLRLRFGMSF